MHRGSAIQRFRKMSSFDREKQLFLAALKLPTPAERDAFLRGACSDDADLLRRLKVLVASHDQSQGPLDQRPSGLELRVSDEDATLAQPFVETVERPSAITQRHSRWSWEKNRDVVT